MGKGPKPPKSAKRGKAMMPVPIIVPLNSKNMIGAALNFVVGVPALTIFWIFNNEAPSHLQRECPVIHGRLYDWGFSMACILLFVFGACLCRSGIVSRVLQGLGQRNEAICVGVCCMGTGILGTVIDVSLFFLIICFTSLGSSLLYEAVVFGVDWDDRDDKYTYESDAKYCSPTVFFTVIALQALVYLVVAAASYPYLAGALFQVCCPKPADEDTARRAGKRKRLEERPPKSLTQQWREDPESIMNVLKIDLPESSSDDEDSPFSKEILAKVEKQKEKEEKMRKKQAENKEKERIANKIKARG